MAPVLSFPAKGANPGSQGDDWLAPLRQTPWRPCQRLLKRSVCDRWGCAGWAGRRQTVPCEGRAGGGVKKEEPRTTARLWEHSGKARAWSLSRCQGSALGTLARIWGPCCVTGSVLQKERCRPPGAAGKAVSQPPAPASPAQRAPRGQAPVAVPSTHARPSLLTSLPSLVENGS